MEFCIPKSQKAFSYLRSCIYTGTQATGSIEWNRMSNQALHLTPEAVAFFASAISEQNFAFAKFSLASGAGELYVICATNHRESPKYEKQLVTQ